jgi:hypothetical protein
MWKFLIRTGTLLLCIPRMGSSKICCLKRVDQRPHKDAMKIRNKIDFVPCFPQLDPHHAAFQAEKSRFTGTTRFRLHKDRVRNLLKSLQVLPHSETRVGAAILQANINLRAGEHDGQTL